MPETTTHWACLDCQAKGAYIHKAKTGATGPAHVHTETESHATTSGTDSERVARMAGGSA